jgi:hypothetical protein
MFTVPAWPGRTMLPCSFPWAHTRNTTPTSQHALHPIGHPSVLNNPLLPAMSWCCETPGHRRWCFCLALHGQPWLCLVSGWSDGGRCGRHMAHRSSGRRIRVSAGSESTWKMLSVSCLPCVNLEGFCSWLTYRWGDHARYPATDGKFLIISRHDDVRVTCCS